MRSGTITCHRAYNYGAVLQTYALQKHLNDLGYENIIIDYIAPYLRKKDGSIIKRVIWKIYRAPDFIKFRKPFDEFRNSYILSTSEYYSLKQLKDTPPDCEIYISGSDQVWNPSMENGRDPAYFLDFGSSKIKRCSYAASIAQEDIDNCTREFFKKELSHFEYISVREETGKKILERIGFGNVETVLDPVYLLTRDEWRKLAIPFLEKEKYVLIYAFNCTQELIQMAIKIAEKNNCKIYVINTLIKDFKIPADRHFWGISPRMFISLFEHADFVVTNSFHGLSFSVLFEKQVFVFSKQSGGNSRLFDLMKKLNMANCVNGEFIDYTIVNIALEQERIKANNYIRGVFDEKRS